jgi:hypothetical protein
MNGASCSVVKECAHNYPPAPNGDSGHFRRCIRTCSNCSLKSHKDAYRARSRKCGCGFYRYEYIPYERFVWACRACKSLGPAGLAEKRLRYEGVQEKQKPAAESPRCGKCSVRLPKYGPRWYSCQNCGGECMSSLHKPWSWGRSTSGFRFPSSKPGVSEVSGL